MSRKYHIWTIGCQMNEADSRHLSSQVEALGYVPTVNANEADLVVLNTCVVRQSAEDRAIGRLSTMMKIKERRPNMTVALMGCMVGMREAPALKKKFPFVDVFMPPSVTTPLLEYLEQGGLFDESILLETRAKAVRDAIQDEDYILPAVERGRSVTAHVPVVLGCSHACTFCVIPYRRGAEESRPKADVLREVRALSEQGVKEVTLLGQIIDRYGLDLDDDYDLSSLLRDVAQVAGIARVRFLTSHPNWITDRLIDTVAEVDKICPQFEVPAQAGNNEVLENMRRGYTIEEYRRVVDRIRKCIPDAAIHTDIIVGFCGETDEQFMDTYRLFEECRFDKAHIAKYSVRPKTIATRQMRDDVSSDEKERRRKMLDDLQSAMLTDKMKGLRETTVEVLVEDRDVKKNRWRGRTPHNKLVFFEDDRDLRGKILPVHVDWTGPYSLIGRAMDAVHLRGPAKVSEE
ncbi:MAG: tRNA (N6-isopentenyl adenosine(37)-C2)-methylthiotransferase MiaB [Verrucomicrobia bacterium]|nr:tRNA (N6-isopentenyl adenosine(37)-C2)-methylthiotransferase MiaB [Verrucomicrobiota bacterium]